MDQVRPLFLIWPHALVCLCVLAWTYTMEIRQYRYRKSRSADHSGPDRYSGLVISIGTIGLQAIAVALSFYAPTVFSSSWVMPLLYLGLGIIVAGMVLRIHCWRVLGAFFTHTVTISSDHQVVNDGAYRWLRHPSYLGALLIFAGVGLVLGNYASLITMCLGSWVIYIYRIEVEESALETALGESYTRFKQTRKRLIPFVY